MHSLTPSNIHLAYVAMDTNASTLRPWWRSMAARLHAVCSAVSRALHDSREQEAARVIRRYAHLMSEAEHRALRADLEQIVTSPTDGRPGSRPLERQHPPGTARISIRD